MKKELKLEREQALKIIFENFNFKNISDLKKSFGPDTFGQHEAFDRLHVVNSMIEHHLASHPAIVANEKAFEKVHKAIELLCDAYQIIGNE